MLHNKFVCGYRDISNEPYCGNSGAHSTGGNAVETTNGSGSHNIQLFVMDPDGTVLHCMPGYWNPNDLAGELQLAERLDSVWRSNSMSSEQKKVSFAKMQIEHFRQHPRELTARSHMQGFDRKHELEKKGFNDTLRIAANPNALSWQDGGDDLVKTTDEIMHDRMSQRPFLSYQCFDTAKFADYGTRFYDKHEDNLDENGNNMNPDAKTITMRDEISKQRRLSRSANASGAGGGNSRAPHLQVKTYGSLKNSR